MKRVRQLQGIWMVCMAEAVVMGLVLWILQGGAPPAVAGMSAQFVAWVLAVVTVVDVWLAVWLFRATWLPLCERALKRVWAGRLTNAAEARAIAQTLSTRGIVIMGLLAAPSCYAVLWVWLGGAHRPVAAALVGLSVLGLGAFHWEGLQPAAGIFQHTERISAP